MPGSARYRRWLGWFFLGLFWLVQVGTVSWFIAYQMVLGQPFPMAGDMNFIRTILVWLLATVLSGALVLLVPPPEEPGVRRRRKVR